MCRKQRKIYVWEPFILEVERSLGIIWSKLLSMNEQIKGNLAKKGTCPRKFSSLTCQFQRNKRFDCMSTPKFCSRIQQTQETHCKCTTYTKYESIFSVTKDGTPSHKAKQKKCWEEGRRESESWGQSAEQQGTMGLASVESEPVGELRVGDRMYYKVRKQRDGSYWHFKKTSSHFRLPQIKSQLHFLAIKVP